MTGLGCDACGSRWFVRVYADGETGASTRACWRPFHRRVARTVLARRVAILRRFAPPRSSG